MGWPSRDVSTEAYARRSYLRWAGREFSFPLGRAESSSQGESDQSSSRRYFHVARRRYRPDLGTAAGEWRSEADRLLRSLPVDCMPREICRVQMEIPNKKGMPMALGAGDVVFSDSRKFAPAHATESCSCAFARGIPATTRRREGS